MICPACKKDRLESGAPIMYLVDGVCPDCRKLPSFQPRKAGYIVKIIKDWYYDGGRCIGAKCRLPARKGKKCARVFISLAPAKKAALKYGGIVETI